MQKTGIAFIIAAAFLLFYPAITRAASASFNGPVGIGSTTPIVSLDMSQEEDALSLPVGSTSSRPTGGALINGEIRYNSTTPGIEAYIDGAWSSLSGASGDSFWNNVVFMPRAEAGNTGADLSSFGATLTVTNATTSNSGSQQDAYAWVFNGTSAVVTTPSSSMSALTGDFTIEAWYNQNSITSPVSQTLISELSNGPTSWNVSFGNTGDGGRVEFDHTGTVTVVSSAGGNTPAGTWNHVAVVRQGGLIYLWVNGALQGTASDTTVFGAQQVNIGHVSAGNYFNGLISGIRITKYARYTAPFTPPTTPFLTNQLGGP